MRANLSGADFTEPSLAGADLTDADLNYTNLN
ncbi:pentapeptide repeat-containing protein [Cyanobacteria bacterium FACHB-DQ100]|nr:pentapeptide repeat-containing protein [Cyanobacteria bacterium FACHB-DQ100]